jgi:hypothetical protein
LQLRGHRVEENRGGLLRRSRRRNQQN